MAKLTLCWEYLTGYAVATAPSSRDQCEWPPHPARVFMAMAAAWFETPPEGDATESVRDTHEEEGEALRYLESLEPPELWLPSEARQGERSPVTCYVPVNDRAGPAAATLQSAPALTRSKQARTFPRRYVGTRPVALHWPEAEQVSQYHDALIRVCSKVTRIGHSSSLVSMWVAEPGSEQIDNELERWQVDELLGELHCRRVAPGLLDSLPQQTRIPEIERFAQQFWRVTDAQHVAAGAKGSGDNAQKRKANKAVREAKNEFELVTGQSFRASSYAPPLLRPKIGLWSSYRPARPPEPKIPGTTFDTDLMMLTGQDSPSLPISATLDVARALRNTIMKFSPVQPVPRWVSGHKADGSPSDNDDGHLALLPLPFVGRQHADGHLLGMALAFPRSIPHLDRGQVLGPLLLHQTGEPRDIILQLGHIGTWTLRKRDWNEQRLTLQPENWTAVPQGSECWNTVTPVVLDKFPKSDRSDRHAWEAEVRLLIVESCRRIGLPDPMHVDIDTTSWQIGCPRAFIKDRRLRDHSNSKPPSFARLGDGFPTIPTKHGSTSRPQVHVFLQFRSPVCGPIILGTGRFRGYGLFKPMSASR